MIEPKAKVAFTILGEPLGKGRPRFSTAGGFARAITPERTVNYETLVKMEYQAQCGGYMFDHSDALGMRITAFKPIPKSTSKRKRVLMEERLMRPAKKPDWDNIGKIICDALNKVAFHDDAQIVDGRVIKVYSDQPRVIVEIWREGESG